MKINPIILTTIALIALTGCKEGQAAPVSETITDEQLIELLATNKQRFMSTRKFDPKSPPRIHPDVVQCIEIYGGAENEITGTNLPEEFMTALMETCDTQVQKLLDKSENNPLQVTLKDFVNLEFANRITALSVVLNENFKKYLQTK